MIVTGDRLTTEGRDRSNDRGTHQRPMDGDRAETYAESTNSSSLIPLAEASKPLPHHSAPPTFLFFANPTQSHHSLDSIDRAAPSSRNPASPRSPGSPASTTLVPKWLRLGPKPAAAPCLDGGECTCFWGCRGARWYLDSQSLYERRILSLERLCGDALLEVFEGE